MFPLYKRERRTFVIYRVAYLLILVMVMTLVHLYGRYQRPSDSGPDQSAFGGEVKPRRSDSYILRKILQAENNGGGVAPDNAHAQGNMESATRGSALGDRYHDDDQSQATTELAGNHTDEEEICTPPAYHEFPQDLFTTKQRQHGALIFHFMMVVYMFVALAIVCDVYFVASLEKISEKLHLSKDVAGATFMAAGSSAPELFTSIIGVFVAKGDVGVGTIVGSAVFNILFVIGICGLMVSQIVMLTWWPLIRDSFFYSLSVIILILSISDGAVQWYEAAIMLLLYVGYILTMAFDTVLQKLIVPKVHIFGEAAEDTSAIINPAEEHKYYQSYEMFKNEENGHASAAMGNAVIRVDEYVLKSTGKLSFEDACFRFMKSRRFKPLTRFRAAAFIIICERRKLVSDAAFMRRQKMKTFSYDSDATSYTQAVRKGLKSVDEADLRDSWARFPNIDEGIGNMLRWVTTWPLNILLYFTIPDCRQKRWDRWYIASFLLSLMWITIFSYVMVWMVALIGYTLGIPDSIMGITFLAAGTSVPDAMASVMVARQGQGDMAVSNTIGSNVFDILIGLALPWFVKTTMVSVGSEVHINSNGMVFSVVLLFLTVIITICAIHFGGWKLDKKLAAVCLTSYAIFLLFSCLIEFNVFGYVNAPMCREG